MRKPTKVSTHQPKMSSCSCSHFCNKYFGDPTNLQGFKILDPTGQNWLFFTYDIDATTYSGTGFFANYSLGA